MDLLFGELFSYENGLHLRSERLKIGEEFKRAFNDEILMSVILDWLYGGVDEMKVIILSCEFNDETGLLWLPEGEVGGGLEREDVEHDKL